MNTNVADGQARRAALPAMAIEVEANAQDVLRQIGVITRHLHDALWPLGYGRTLSNAVETLPDARARLDYIARLTGESAEKVLDTVEHARATQTQVRQGANALAARWQGSAETHSAGLIADTREFLGSVAASTRQTNAYLTEIMLAQDFHDLTGQVIRRLVDLAQHLEQELLALLLLSPSTARGMPLSPASALSGPDIRQQSRADSVSCQSQVDDLLENLGF